MHQVHENTGTLNSWKEIASYMGRGVRTVQRWEAELDLPVHRIGSGERSPVFAFKAEVDNWVRRQAGTVRQVVQGPACENAAAEAERRHDRSDALNRSVLFTSQARRLLEIQKIQTKVLAERVRRMTRLVPRPGSWQPRKRHIRFLRLA